MDLTELLQIAQKERDRQKKIRIRCCGAAGCVSSNSIAVKNSLEKAVTAAGLEDTVEVASVGCMKFCGRGPLVQVDPSGTIYEQTKPEDASSIVAALNGGAATATVGDPNHPF